MPLYLEDLHPGERFESGDYAITEAAIIAFAREFDPQPFHLDADAAKASIFGGLVASGWHTAAISMRLLATSPLQLAGGTIGLAVEAMAFPRPVRPGDLLRLAIEIVDIRPSRSKPERGTIRIHNVLTNSRGETVQELTATILGWKRPLTESR